MGNGTLTRINGTMGTIALLGGLDFEDMFLINIVDPMKFRATTDGKDPELGGGKANFNTMVWLFRPTSADPPEALGFLGNDDHPDVPASILSLLIPVPTDGSPPLVDAGLYYIAITRANNVPDSDGGEIFFFDPLTPTEISGPDGPSGLLFLPISGWTGDNGGAFEGAYTIALRGVEFAESPCPADLDGSGDVGVSDFLQLLGNWGRVREESIEASRHQERAAASPRAVSDELHSIVGQTKALLPGDHGPADIQSSGEAAIDVAVLCVMVVQVL